MKAIVPMFLLLTACGGLQHIHPHTARHRQYEPGPYENASVATSDGSLWQEGSRGLFADFRAANVGDLVTIRVDENPRATGDASTQMDRESSMSMGIPNLFGLTSALTRAYPDLDAEQLLSLVSERHFDGQGDTSRASRIQASIAVRVRRVLPNGDLFIEGTKILMVNDEELHIYLSGVIRPQDIAQDNSVSSGQIADAEIELTGRGDLTENQRQGWLSRLMTEVMPF